MTMPSVFDLALPLLRLAAQGEVGYAEVTERLADELGLSDAECSEMLPSGLHTQIATRVRWAKVRLGMAALVENTRPGRFRASKRGSRVLEGSPPRIDHAFLLQFDEYRRKKGPKEAAPDDLRDGLPESGADPITTIEKAAAEVAEVLADDLLQRVLAVSPLQFELLIIKLMLAMGFGGSRADAGRHLGQSGDGGVDGVIDGDPLGLDAVYLQAKRYAPGSSVGRPEVQAFVGSLIGRSASKGVFVTTSVFSQPARDFVRSVPYRVIMIDGARLTELMIRYGVGVRTRQTVEIKEVDENFFSSDLA